MGGFQSSDFRNFRKKSVPSRAPQKKLQKVTESVILTPIAPLRAAPGGNHTATMAITVTQFQTHLEAARVALGNEDYVTAETQAMQAQAALAGIPDGELGEGQVAWRDTVDKLLVTIRRARTRQSIANVGGIRRTKVEYV